MGLELVRHILIKLQEDIEDPPEVKRWLVDKLNKVVHFELLHAVDVELNLASADYN